jgi:hypothetical protein
MKNLSLLLSAIAASACLASTPVSAQTRGIAPRPALHVLKSSLSLSAPASDPLQEQMQQDYATSLMGGRF